MENVCQGDLNRWICDFRGCNFRTKRKRGLNLHKAIHEVLLERRRPFPCTFGDCQYRAGQKQALKLHIRNKQSLERTKDSHCPLCPKKFYTEKEMKFHLPFHTKEKSLACDLCKFKSFRGCDLRRHIKRIHNEVVQYKCDFPGCDYSAREKRSHKRHYISHSLDPLDRRPFPCNFPDCDYRGVTQYALRRHVDRLHNPDRTAVECPLCSKRISYKCNLKEHINSVRTLEKTFHCNQCTYSTAYHRYPGADLRGAKGAMAPPMDLRSTEILQLKLHGTRTKTA